MACEPKALTPGMSRKEQYINSINIGFIFIILLLTVAQKRNK